MNNQKGSNNGKSTPSDTKNISTNDGGSTQNPRQPSACFNVQETTPTSSSNIPQQVSEFGQKNRKQNIYRETFDLFVFCIHLWSFGFPKNRNQIHYHHWPLARHHQYQQRSFIAQIRCHL